MDEAKLRFWYKIKRSPVHNSYHCSQLTGKGSGKKEKKEERGTGILYGTGKYRKNGA
jgi:hypothetical protein